MSPGARAAGVRPGGGRHRAGGDRHEAEREQRPRRARHADVGRPLAGHPRRPRAPHQHAPGDDHHHREDQVGHHPPGGEAVEDRQPAHHGLAEDAEREQPAEDRQVAPERAARERQQERRHRADADHAGQQPVAELDVGVGPELGREPPVLVAVGPVRAPEPRAGDAHGRAGEDDQHQGPERDGGDPEVLPRGEADPLHASAIVAAARLTRRGRRPSSPRGRRPARATGRGAGPARSAAPSARPPER